MMLLSVQADLVPRAGDKEGRPQYLFTIHVMRCVHPDFKRIILQNMSRLRRLEYHREVKIIAQCMPEKYHWKTC